MQIGQRSGKRLAAVLLLCLGLVGTQAGCAYEPAYYRKAEIKKPFKSAPADPQIIQGRKILVLDALGHYVFSLPAKLILWNWSVDNHKISKENEAILAEYLLVNGLSTTQARLNTYAPHKEFARLVKNKDVNWFYKYTFGTISVLFYTVIPERIFAGLISGDHYNPYTNTINVYSNHPAILIHEGGHAKDLAQRSKRGTYALVRILPGGDLHQEYLASSDAIDYFYCREDQTNELNAYPILIPAYATYVAGYLPIGLDAAAIVGAHVYSRYYRDERREELSRPQRVISRGTCWRGETGAKEGSTPLQEPGGG